MMLSHAPLRSGIRCAARRAAGALALGCALLLAACSQVPDWADPTDWFEADAPASVVAQGDELDRPTRFPNLASVPDAPPQPTPAPQRARIKRALAEDRASADYTALPATDATAPTGTQEAAAPGAGLRELLGVVYFGHGSAALGAESEQVLRDIAALRRQRGGTLRVIGHASAAPPGASGLDPRLANFTMSLRRANAIAARLRALGVPGERLHAEARGDSQPASHEAAPSGAAANRRAEIFLEY